MKVTVYLEPNEKYGEGYQLHPVVTEDNGMESDFQVVDFHPYDYRKATIMAEKVLEIIRQRYGHDLRVEEALVPTVDGLLANVERDAESAKLYKEISTKHKDKSEVN